MIKSFSQVVFSLAVLASVYSCTKKKPDPQPTAPTTTTSGSTTSSGTTTSTSSGSTTSATTHGASFNDGTSNHVATIVEATKDNAKGHLTISIMKGADLFPTVFISIGSINGTGTYKDDNSQNTYGQIKYSPSPSDSYTTDLLNGKTCTITVSALTANHITGTFTFKGTQTGTTNSKNVTGSFNCPYQVK